MRGASKVTLQPHQILRLPRNLEAQDLSGNSLTCFRDSTISEHNPSIIRTQNRHLAPAASGTLLVPSWRRFCMVNTTFRAPAISQNVTKCCACHEKSPSNFTKYCACHEKSPSNFTKYCAATQYECRLCYFTKLVLCGTVSLSIDYFADLLLYRSVTLLMCYFTELVLCGTVSLPMYYFADLLLYESITLRIYYCTDLLLYESSTLRIFYCTKLLLYGSNTLRIYYFTNLLLYESITLRIYYCTDLLLYESSTLRISYCTKLLLYWSGTFPEPPTLLN